MNDRMNDRMNEYNEAFQGGMSLLPTTIDYLEMVKTCPSFSSRVDKNGNKRIYISHPQLVYTAGGRSYVRQVTRYIGQVRNGRSSSRIQMEALFVMAVGGLNRHAMEWWKANVGKGK